jgi:hypothetical protein
MALESWRLVPLLALVACAAANTGQNVGGDDLLSAEPDLGAEGGPDLLMSQDLSASDMRAPDDLRMPGPDLRPITGCTEAPQPPVLGCPAGMKCTTHDSMTTICDPNGTSLRGAPCTVTGVVDSCVAGSLCIDEGGSKSQCRAFCKTDAHCGANSYCDFTVGSFKVCTQACNALPPGTAGCQGGLGCVVYGREHTDCQNPGMSDAGQPCASVRDCKGGMACIGVGAALCRRTCRKGMNGDCPAGNLCVPVASGGYNWVTYGVCCPGGTC